MIDIHRTLLIILLFGRCTKGSVSYIPKFCVAKSPQCIQTKTTTKKKTKPKPPPPPPQANKIELQIESKSKALNQMLRKWTLNIIFLRKLRLVGSNLKQLLSKILNFSYNLCN